MSEEAERAIKILTEQKKFAENASNSTNNEYRKDAEEYQGVFELAISAISRNEAVGEYCKLMLDMGAVSEQDKGIDMLADEILRILEATA